MQAKIRIPRDYNMLTMVGRKTGAFKDQRKGRGGSRNDKQSFLEEYEDSQQHEEPEDENGS